VAGLEKPTGGRIAIGKQRSMTAIRAAKSRPRRVGLVFQSYACGRTKRCSRMWPIRSSCVRSPRAR
jgi:predicted ABC-type transport system involved in lysophospholipase L1 biosynthesis ATPase subunit